MDLKLEDRRALVTGGSKGIGLAIAEELVGEGVDVAICARHAVEVDEAAAGLRRSGRTVHGAVADVTDPEQVTAFVKGAASALGGLDILVNNAGAHGRDPSRHSPTRTGAATSTSSCSPRSAARAPRCRTCVPAPRRV